MKKNSDFYIPLFHHAYATTSKEDISTVESFGIVAQILGVKDECSDKDKSLDGILYDSHMRYDPICGIIHFVFKYPWRDLEILLLVTEEMLLQVLSRTNGAHKILEDLVGRIQMEERQSGIVGRVYISEIYIIRREMEEMKNDYFQFFMD